VVRRSGYHEIRIDTSDDEAARISAGTFGIGRVERVRPVHFPDLDGLARTVAELAGDRVAGRTFAVRIRRRGSHDWRARDAESAIGRLLLDRSAGVDLDHPQAVVRVHIFGEVALMVESDHQGINGLPLGTQEPALVLLSGGIDSPVAAWMMMRSGCPVDLLHLTMECSVSDQALAVGHHLAEEWGHGSSPRLHVIDFQPIKDALRERVDPRLRQVVLKQLMIAAAEKVAERLGIPMLVTGDSLGQVSSQTAAHLLEVDREVAMPLLRPLVALRKEEIVARAREIGTFDISSRTREVCDLADGHRVATRASRGQLADGRQKVGTRMVEEALTTWRSVDARDWWPGMPMPSAA
jgi:thiamine biosynthesis protein ThiI